MSDALLEIAQHTLTAGAAHLGLSEADRKKLLEPERSLSCSFQLETADGPELIQAWRVQHNLRRGPGKGGVRYSEDASLAEVTGLAMIMTLKNALSELPFGGAKGAVQVDASSLSDSAREELAEALAERFGAFVGPETDILGPDVGTGPTDMAAFARSWGTLMDCDGAGVATGKPTEHGGIELRTGATAAGCARAIRVARERVGLDQSATVAIQGFGALGRELALLLAADGHRIVAVSDSSGGMFSPDGLDVEALSEAKKDGTSVADADVDAKAIDSFDVLTCAADIVVPAALQAAIDPKIAKAMDTRLVVEGSNAPTTVAGIAVLSERGIPVVPDFAANAGGVVVSWHEWRTNQGDPAEDAEADLGQRLVRINEEAWDRSDHDDVDLRTAAAAIAIERVLDA